MRSDVVFLSPYKNLDEGDRLSSVEGGDAIIKKIFFSPMAKGVLGRKK